MTALASAVFKDKVVVMTDSISMTLDETEFYSQPEGKTSRVDLADRPILVIGRGMFDLTRTFSKMLVESGARSFDDAVLFAPEVLKEATKAYAAEVIYKIFRPPCPGVVRAEIHMAGYSERQNCMGYAFLLNYGKKKYKVLTKFNKENKPKTRLFLYTNLIKQKLAQNIALAKKISDPGDLGLITGLRLGVFVHREQALIEEGRESVISGGEIIKTVLYADNRVETKATGKHIPTPRNLNIVGTLKHDGSFIPREGEQ